MNAFEHLHLSGQLMKAIHRLGFKEPTQIQRETIPFILKGRDVIGESATGSGKTLAFGAGIIEICEARKVIQALVLVPTRELAEQVKSDLVTFAHEKPITILPVYGGVSIGKQIEGLRKTDVVIATPGRLLDHLGRRTIDLSQVKIVVLDEADRMIDMGFINDVEKILKACPEKRQTLLFSATLYEPTKRIARRYMNDPKIVHATKMVDPTKLRQSYYQTTPKFKKELLVHFIKKEKSDLVMVFCNTRRTTDRVYKVLKQNGVKSAPIHGGLTQSNRLKTIDWFNKGKFQVLVCTDVAARGLHIEGVTHIYNYDIPKDPGDYVHRIGRTARAGKNGLVINILAPSDQKNFSRLVSAHRDFNIQRGDSPDPNVTAKDFVVPTRNDTSRDPKSQGHRRGGSRGHGRKKPKFGKSRHSKSRPKRNFKRKRN